MKTKHLVGALAALGIAVSLYVFFLSGPEQEPLNQQEAAAEFNKKIAGVVIPFVENKGQVEGDVSYYADTFAGKIGVTTDGVIYAFNKTNTGSDEVATSFLKESFTGGAPVVVTAGDTAATQVSYFKGSDSKNWQSGLPTFSSLSLGEIWKGISVELKAYGNNVEKLFTVQPSVDPKTINITLTGAKNVSVEETGRLRVTTAGGDIELTKPVAYQVDGDEKIFVPVAYELTGPSSYTFALGDYDNSRAVVIDPLLASTYVGAGDTDHPYEVIVSESTGYVFVAGYSASANFPTTTGAYDTARSGTNDAVVIKLNNTLTSLLASTYIGGTSSDKAFAMALDSSDNVYITGFAGTAFPTTAGVYDETYNGGGADVFVSKLNSDLTTLSLSTVVGSVVGDEYGYAIKLDSSGNVYVAGETYDAGFPVTSGAYDETFGTGDYDAFVFKLNSTFTTLSASTFLGGASYEHVEGMAIDSSNNIFVVGYTSGTDFPTTTGAYDTSSNGGDDGFIAKFNSDLTSLSASTLLGGSSSEEIFDIEFDASGNVIVVGRGSAGFPTTAGAYDETAPGGFIAKFNSTLTTLSASTMLGPSGTVVDSLAISGSGDIFVAGVVTTSTFPVTSGAYDETYSSQDAFISKLNSTLTTLSVSTFLGGSGSEYAYGMTIDSSGKVFVVGTTGSTNFPTTTGAYDTTSTGNTEMFISKFSRDLLLVAPANNAPSSTLPSSIAQSGDTLTFAVSVTDADLDETSLTIEHSTNGSSWSSSTIGAVSLSEGAVSTSTASITAIDTDSDGAVTLTISWLVGTDLDNTDDSTVYLRVRPYDGTDYGGNATSTAFAIETIDPTAPTITLTPNPSSIVFTVTATSTDTNFSEYKLFYNTSGSVSVSDSSYTSSTNSSMASSTFSGATVSNLNPSTLYYFKLFAFDTFGNSTSSAEVSARTPSSGGSSGSSSSGSSRSTSSNNSTTRTETQTTPRSNDKTTTPDSTDIASLMAELARLEALLRARGVTPVLELKAARDLQVGDVGEDVRALQIYLNTKGFTVASSGPGSRGQETTRFGALTKAALIRFQEAHAADILIPNGLTRGTGYYGAATRGYIAAHP